MQRPVGGETHPGGSEPVRGAGQFFSTRIRAMVCSVLQRPVQGNPQTGAIESVREVEHFFLATGR